MEAVNLVTGLGETPNNFPNHYSDSMAFRTGQNYQILCLCKYHRASVQKYKGRANPVCKSTKVVQTDRFKRTKVARTDRFRLWIHIVNVKSSTRNSYYFAYPITWICFTNVHIFPARNLRAYLYGLDSELCRVRSRRTRATT